MSARKQPLKLHQVLLAFWAILNISLKLCSALLCRAEGLRCISEGSYTEAGGSAQAAAEAPPGSALNTRSMFHMLCSLLPNQSVVTVRHH